MVHSLSARALLLDEFSLDQIMIAWGRSDDGSRKHAILRNRSL